MYDLDSPYGASPATRLAAAEEAVFCVDDAPVAAPLLVADAATPGSRPAAAAEPSAEPLVAAASQELPQEKIYAAKFFKLVIQWFGHTRHLISPCRLARWNGALSLSSNCPRLGIS